VGKLISARKILIGSASALGDSIMLNVRIVDVEKGVAEFASKQKADSESSLDIAVETLVRNLSMRISGKTGGVIPQSDKVYPSASKDKNTSGSGLLYSRISISGAYIDPAGRMDEILEPGFAAMLGFYGNMLGYELGVLKFPGEDGGPINDYTLTLMMLNIHYSIPVTGWFNITPSISAGGGFTNTKLSAQYYNRQFSGTEFDTTVIGFAGVMFDFWPSRNLGLHAGPRFGLNYEPDGNMYFISYSAAVSYRF